MLTDLYFSASLRQIEARFGDQPLMQHAGCAAADFAASLLVDRRRPILILAGPGNNGGDAFEVARLLRQRDFDIHLVFTGTTEGQPADASAAHQRFLDGDGKTLEEIPTNESWGLIIDGLFGIGLKRPPEGRHAELIKTANRLAERDHCPLLALDCPSGLNADTGIAPGAAIQASHTISFISGKPGLLTADGPDYCGRLRIADLALTLDTQNPPDGHLISKEDFAHLLKPRKQNTHKGSFGSSGILGGSKSMLGAALLAARAALKIGAGRVYGGLLDPDAPAIDPQQPELMLRRADTLLQTPDLASLACGPGLGRSGEAIRLVEQAVKCALPLVLDADALNILASDGRLEGNLYNRVAPAILTPHPAEAARLLETSVREIQNDRIAAARELARRYNSHIALKGCGTVIATVDGRWWINTSGNPGMASAGMGDVLTGLIAGLLAQGWPAQAALLAGVHLHGAAADQLVAEGQGPIGLVAGEVIDAARRLLNQWITAT